MEEDTQELDLKQENFTIKTEFIEIEEEKLESFERSLSKEVGITKGNSLHDWQVKDEMIDDDSVKEDPQHFNIHEEEFKDCKLQNVGDPLLLRRRNCNTGEETEIMMPNSSRMDQELDGERYSVVYLNPPSKIEVFKSKRGKDKIGLNGYSYRRDRDTTTSITWRCDVKGCKGRLKTPLDYTQSRQGVEVGEHCHALNPAKVASVIAVSAMKHNSVRNDHAPQRVISETMVGLTDEVIVQLPSQSNLRRTIQRKRSRNEAFPPLPQTANFTIPSLYRTVTINDEEECFLLHDTYKEPQDDGDDEDQPQNRIIIFATDEMLTLLQRSQHWMTDGTFKIAPEVFMQMYTIHAICGNNVIPCVYSLMTSKHQDTYEMMWKIIKDKKPGLNPETCSMDFEVSAHQAMRTIFPRVKISGCFFHLGQSVWRKITDLGLKNAYINDENTRVHSKMLTALAFVESDRVADSFDDLDESREQNNLHELTPLYAYFEDTYIGRRQRKGRKRPAFDIETWNVRERMKDGLPRSNNKIEEWHRGIQSMFQGAKPTVWKCLIALKKEQVLQHAELVQLQAGSPGKKMEKKYERVNVRLQRLIEGDNDENILDFLRNVSYNLELHI